MYCYPLRALRVHRSLSCFFRYNRLRHCGLFCPVRPPLSLRSMIIHFITFGRLTVHRPHHYSPALLSRLRAFYCFKQWVSYRAYMRLVEAFKGLGRHLLFHSSCIRIQSFLLHTLHAAPPSCSQNGSTHSVPQFHCVHSPTLPINNL